MEFDPNNWNCPCGGVADVFQVNLSQGDLGYYLLECKTCGKWRRFIPNTGEQDVGEHLPEEVQAALNERGDKIRSAPDPLAGAHFVAVATVAPMDGGIPPAGAQPTAPPQMEQGAIVPCGYCGDIYPELKGNCPVCKGGGPSFRPARMMDRETSSRELLPQILMLHALEESINGEEGKPGEALVKEYRQALISLVEKINLYDFDLKEALAQKLRELDSEFEIDPEEE